MAGILSLLVALFGPYILYRIVKYYRRGKVIDGGTVVISKKPKSDVFEDTIKLNGKKIDCIFDTGASVTTIGIKDAQKIGFDPSNLMFITNSDTAAGEMQNALAEAEVDILEVGPITIKKFGIYVNRLVESQCLLGMNFFDSLDSFEIKNEKLILKLTPKNRPDRDRTTYANQADAPAPVNSQPLSDIKILARCPHCDRKMALPMQKKGTVRCKHCDIRFSADTSRVEDGFAETKRLDT